MSIPLEELHEVQSYIEGLYVPEADIITRYKQIAADKYVRPHMVDPIVAKLLQQLVATKQPEQIVEIGTLWGYSSWWMLQSLPTNGHITTIEKELKHFRVAQDFFTELEDSRVTVMHADALEVMASWQPESVDMIFLDADKTEYPELYELGLAALKQHGIFVMDNVVASHGWPHTVAKESEHDRIQIVRALHEQIAHDTRVVANTLPIGSGILVCVKK